MNRLKMRLSVRVVDDGRSHHIVEAFVDDVPLADFARHAIDVPFGLLPSVERDGYWYIITCTCGDPGCGGVFYGVEVRHREGKVHWHVPEPGPMRDYVFDEVEYHQEIRAMIDEARRAVAGSAVAEPGKNDFAPYDNDLFFKGALDDSQLTSTWDAAPQSDQSSLRPWRTKY